MEYRLNIESTKKGDGIICKMTKHINRYYDEDLRIVKKSGDDGNDKYFLFYKGIDPDNLPENLCNPPIISLDQSMVNFIGRFAQK